MSRGKEESETGSGKGITRIAHKEGPMAVICKSKEPKTPNMPIIGGILN